MGGINLLYGVPLSANVSENIVKTQLKTEFAQKGIDVNEIYISFTKKNVATMLSDSEKAIDVAVIAEFLERDGMKESEISSLLEINEDIVIIPIVEAKHKGDAFLKNLFANGVYNCIRNDESNIIDMIVSLIQAPRKLSKAREYYYLSKNEDFSSTLEKAAPVAAPPKGFGKKERKKKVQEESLAVEPSSENKKESEPEAKKADNNVIKVQKVSVQEELIIEERGEEKEDVRERKEPATSSSSGEQTKIQVKKKAEPTPSNPEISISNNAGSSVVLSSRKISKSEKMKEKVFMILKILVFIIFFLSITLNIMLLSSDTVREILSYTFFGGARM